MFYDLPVHVTVTITVTVTAVPATEKYNFGFEGRINSQRGIRGFETQRLVRNVPIVHNRA